MKSGTIINIEEEIIIAMQIKMRLESQGYNVISLANSVEEGIKLASQLKPDLILTEIVFHGELKGIDAANKIKKLYKIPVIFLTTQSYLEQDPRIVAIKPAGFVSKPVDDKKLFEAVENTPCKS